MRLKNLTDEIFLILARFMIGAGRLQGGWNVVVVKVVMHPESKKGGVLCLPVTSLFGRPEIAPALFGRAGRTGSGISRKAPGISESPPSS